MSIGSSWKDWMRSGWSSRTTRTERCGVLCCLQVRLYKTRPKACGMLRSCSATAYSSPCCSFLAWSLLGVRYHRSQVCTSRTATTSLTNAKASLAALLCKSCHGDAVTDRSSGTKVSFAPSGFHLESSISCRRVPSHLINKYSGSVQLLQVPLPRRYGKNLRDGDVVQNYGPGGCSSKLGQEKQRQVCGSDRPRSFLGENGKPGSSSRLLPACSITRALCIASHPIYHAYPPPLLHLRPLDLVQTVHAKSRVGCKWRLAPYKLSPFDVSTSRGYAGSRQDSPNGNDDEQGCQLGSSAFRRHAHGDPTRSMLGPVSNVESTARPLMSTAHGSHIYKRRELLVCRTVLRVLASLGSLQSMPERLRCLSLLCFRSP